MFSCAGTNTVKLYPLGQMLQVVPVGQMLQVVPVGTDAAMQSTEDFRVHLPFKRLNNCGTIHSKWGKM